MKTEEINNETVGGPLLSVFRTVGGLKLKGSIRIQRVNQLKVN
jgi:hypothetical protein